MNSLPEVFEALSRPHQLAELALIAVALALAALLSRLARHHGQEVLTGGRAVEIGLSGVRRLAFPLFGLLLFLAARVLTRYWFGGHDRLLPGAMVLVGAMLLLRMIMFALQHTFAKGVLLVASMRVVAVAVWVTVALHLFGVLPEVISLLDEISITIGKQRLSLWILLQGAASVLFTLLLALWMSGLVEERLAAAEGLDGNLRMVFSRLSKALLVVLAIMVGLPMAGIDLTTLSVFGGALGVGLGFGLQKIASNYVSGFILLLDRSVILGNVIAVGNERGQVTRITTRYTVLKDVNGVEAIVPNEVLVGSVVKNESYSDPKVRLLLPVQVAYGTNLEQALALVSRCAHGIPRVLDEPPPAAYVDAFADSGITLQLSIWIADPEKGVLSVRSDVNLAIWRALRDAGITIPYPQREVRMV